MKLSTLTAVDPSRDLAACPHCLTIQNPDVRRQGEADNSEPLPRRKSASTVPMFSSQGDEGAPFRVPLLRAVNADAVKPSEAERAAGLLEREFGAVFIGFEDKAGCFAVMISLPAGLQHIGTGLAARALGVSRQRVRVLIEEGRLPALRLGRAHLIRPADLRQVWRRVPGRPAGAK